MKAHIISLFPEVLEEYFSTSIMKIARDKRHFETCIYNLADYSVRNTRRVDRRPYGGFPGMIISAEPLYDCISEIFSIVKRKIPLYYMTPRGDLWNQKKAEQIAKTEEEFIMICGHYEWIDQRIVDMFDIREISIWEFVLTSGELAAMVVLDSMVRLIPGVLSPESLVEESFSDSLNGKKEYPQYTRPEEFMWRKVPEALLSGDPKKIEAWKQSVL